MLSIKIGACVLLVYNFVLFLAIEIGFSSFTFTRNSFAFKRFVSGLFSDEPAYNIIYRIPFGIHDILLY
jgi:hypothetical protein